MDKIWPILSSPLFWVVALGLLIYMKRDAIIGLWDDNKLLIIGIVALLIWLQWSGTFNVLGVVRGAIPNIPFPSIGQLAPQSSQQKYSCGNCLSKDECIKSGGSPSSYCPQGCCPYGYRNQGAGYTHLCACRGSWVPCTSLGQ